MQRVEVPRVVPRWTFEPRYEDAREGVRLDAAPDAPHGALVLPAECDNRIVIGLTPVLRQDLLGDVEIVDRSQELASRVCLQCVAKEVVCRPTAVNGLRIDDLRGGQQVT